MDQSTSQNWVVTGQERELFDQIFETLDTDRDGLIVGTDDNVRKIFLKTALVHTVLAHIWNLCDVQQNGKLNSEQFALAMHLVNEAKRGVELPGKLTPDMIPPSFRPKTMIRKQDSTNKFTDATNQYSGDNKELELLANELKELENEKHNLEHEVTQQETHMKLKESEIKSIKNEIETMLQMIKQLENQRVEATKRLEEMENQSVSLRQQNEELTLTNGIEEAELKSKVDEFEGLKSEEQQFESKVNLLKSSIEKISSEIAESQLLVSKYKAKTIDLEEYENHLREANKEFDVCIASKDVHRLNALIAKQLQAPEGMNLKPEDPFADNEFPSFSNQFAADPFAGEDPFANDDSCGAKQEEDLFANDAFTSSFGKFATDDLNSDDPFNARPNESTPELPLKKKGAPPRPAPPKTNKPQPKLATDPWGNSNPSNDPFAEQAKGFANFDNFANFEQNNTNKIDPFGLMFSPKSQNFTNLDQFANFDDGIARFEDKFEVDNWSSGVKARKQSENDFFDPFAPKTSPINRLFSVEAEKDKIRRDKQISDDYEFALRLSKG